ncbi:MAG: type II toxin-antitoxin system RelE/ParE family toxin [Flavobacteriales bacterium]|nr:type II toxin-antitoxin system RelE/ParE family toxin [Flavobacteriales bacterium]
MEVEFLRAFEKDLTRSNAAMRKKVLQLINKLESMDGLDGLPQARRLSGHKDAYRIRIGDHRLGCFVSGEKVLFARLLHRKEVYRFFP